MHAYIPLRMKFDPIKLNITAEDNEAIKLAAQSGQVKVLFADPRVAKTCNI